MGCGGSSLNGLSRILAKTGLSKNGYRRPRSRPSQEEGSEEPDESFVKEGVLTNLYG